jgi:hypothetical protein
VKFARYKKKRAIRPALTPKRYHCESGIIGRPRS